MALAETAERHRLLSPAVRSARLWGGGGATNDSRRLFGIEIDDTSLDAASRDLVDCAKRRERLRVVFANAHVINEAARDHAYHRVVATADRVFADGSGMALAAALSGAPLTDNVNGTDLFPRLAVEAARAGIGIYLLGGRPGIAAAARHRMQAFGLGDAIVGADDGYFAPGSPEEAERIVRINDSGAGIVLVGMGVPLQDRWIEANAYRLAAPVAAGVGGLFDYFAGAVSRAPHVFRTIGCEWVWRLALEPRRMARRYIAGNAVFLARAVFECVMAHLATLGTDDAAGARAR